MSLSLGALLRKARKLEAQAARPCPPVAPSTPVVAVAPSTPVVAVPVPVPVPVPPPPPLPPSTDRTLRTSTSFYRTPSFEALERFVTNRVVTHELGDPAAGVLLVGPPGSGKSAMLQAITRKHKVELVLFRAWNYETARGMEHKVCLASLARKRALIVVDGAELWAYRRVQRAKGGRDREGEDDDRMTFEDWASLNPPRGSPIVLVAHSFSVPILRTFKTSGAWFTVECPRLRRPVLETLARQAGAELSQVGPATLRSQGDGRQVPIQVAYTRTPHLHSQDLFERTRLVLHPRTAWAMCVSAVGDDRRILSVAWEAGPLLVDDLDDLARERDAWSEDAVKGLGDLRSHMTREKAERAPLCYPRVLRLPSRTERVREAIARVERATSEGTRSDWERPPSLMRGAAAALDLIGGWSTETR